MSITVEVPPEIEDKVRGLPNVQQDIAHFLFDRVAYEDWRKARYSEKARRLLRESEEESERLKASGKTREELFEELRVLHAEITRQL